MFAVFYILVLQAAAIRVILFMLLKGFDIKSRKNELPKPSR